jgi:proteasome accessory factor B
MSNAPPRISKLQRWIDLVAFLSGHRYPVTLERISAHVPAYRDLVRDEGGGADPTVRRMFERDKDELRALGLRIEAHEGLERSSYSLSTRDAYLPLLRLVQEAGQAQPPEPTRAELTRAELARAKAPRAFELAITPRDAEAVVSGLQVLATQPGSPLRAAARGALRKLTVSLPTPESRDDLPDGSPAASTGDPRPAPPITQIEDPETVEAAPTLDTLQRALSARQTLAFRYRSMRRGVEGDRRVDPWGILHEAGTWYLIGRDHAIDAPRMFRVGRISDARVSDPRTVSPGTPASPAPPAFTVPEDFRIGDWAGRRPWEYGSSELPMEEVRVRFTLPRNRWAERNGLGTPVHEDVEVHDSAVSSAVRAFQVRDADAFARWVLGMSGDARILSPAHMRARVDALADAVARMHAPSDAEAEAAPVSPSPPLPEDPR